MKRMRSLVLTSETIPIFLYAIGVTSLVNSNWMFDAVWLLRECFIKYPYQFRLVRGIDSKVFAYLIATKQFEALFECVAPFSSTCAFQL